MHCDRLREGRRRDSEEWLIDHPQTTVPTDPEGRTPTGRLIQWPRSPRRCRPSSAGRQCDLAGAAQAFSGGWASRSQCDRECDLECACRTGSVGSARRCTVGDADGVGGIDGRHHPGGTSGSRGRRCRGGNGQGRRQDRTAATETATEAATDATPAEADQRSRRAPPHPPSPLHRGNQPHPPDD